MEKFTNRIFSKSGRRLLIIFLYFICIGKIFAATPYDNLRFSAAEGQLFMTGSEIEFSLIVPSSHSKNVSLRFPEFDKNVTMSSMKKIDILDENGKKSTLIEFSLEFSQKGFYELKPAIVTVSRRSYFVNFDSFEIKENPFNLIPKIIVVIADAKGKTVKRLEFTNTEVTLNNLLLKRNYPYNFSVYVQNISTVDNFLWDIPHNSIFAINNDWEKTAVEINKKTPRVGENKKITPEVLLQDFEKMYRLADFSWTILSAKENEFPRLQLAYHSFQSHKNIIESKGIVIKVEESSVKAENKKNENDMLYEKAFEEEFEIENGLTELSYEDCVALVQQEKEKLNLFNKLFSKKYGIILKTDLYSIPEESAARVLQINAGEKIQIQEQTDNWYYIVSLDEERKSGWCKKEKVLLIK